ncbi:uncharacterized protein LOC113273090 [Papaver somniferum]|uniref:uncharacterized protein LOC113273090 n=1 Tax=Papaver somniferum TaxID=3469 RepID=UPI000E6FC379|nr:uncharacterized protein LOC113273090 [Papaver somniferum]
MDSRDRVEELPVISRSEDKMIWSGTMSGTFKVSSVAELIRTHYKKVVWVNQVWHPVLHPTTANNVWKLVRGICATYEKIQGKGFSLASKCYLYGKQTENLEHILWFFNFSQLICKWLGGIFLFCNPESYEDVMKFTKHKNSVGKEVWILAASITMMEIWFLRNIIIFDEEKVDIVSLKQRIKQLTKDCSIRMTGYMWDCNYDYQVLRNFDFGRRPTKIQRIIEVKFKLPEENQVLICCDGASRSNPGLAGYGFVCRSSSCEFIYAGSTGIGIATKFLDEIMAVIGSAYWAVQNGKLNIIIYSDSYAAVQAYRKGKLPWFFQVRWEGIRSSLNNVQVDHNVREINFTTDSFSKKRSRPGEGCMPEVSA